VDKVLYLTRNGLLEPLGHSQVLSYLRGLSRDWQIILITREKEEDWADGSSVAAATAECEVLGIDWRPGRFRSRRHVVGAIFDSFLMAWQSLTAVRRDGVKLIHARAYIPAVIAWFVWRLTKIPFIFDMRALWPEELITARRLRRGSLIHKAIAWAERACLRDAAAVVSLTYSAADYLRDRDPVLARQMFSVIPTCADLERFSPRLHHKPPPVIHGCIGTVLSGWFRVDWLGCWFAGVANLDPGAQFEIITRDDPAAVRVAVDPSGLLGERLSIRTRRITDMPETIRAHDLSVMFFTGGLSKIGSAPTRMAEVLGSGLPIVANDGVGDVARILREYQVGVLLESAEPEEVGRAIRNIQNLLLDPDLPMRCRAAAEAVFSLDTGTQAYHSLYRRILSEQLSAVGRSSLPNDRSS
jgi:glycosyltransferase involved in cell wall biosynthesis